MEINENKLAKAVENTITETQIDSEIWLKILNVISKISVSGFFTKKAEDTLSIELLGNNDLVDHILDLITEFRINLIMLCYSDDEIDELIYGIMRFLNVDFNNGYFFINNEVGNLYKPLEYLLKDDVYKYLFLIRINITHFLRCISRSKLITKN